MQINTKFIKIRMVEKDIASGSDLAKLLGLSRSAVSEMLRGVRQPTLETLSKLCDVLECTPNDLLMPAETQKGPGRRGRDDGAVAPKAPALVAGMTL